jgi:hypothetical protein
VARCNARRRSSSTEAAFETITVFTVTVDDGSV